MGLIRKNYAELIDTYQDISLYAFTKTNSGIKDIDYYIYETEDSYICRPDYVGRGVILPIPEKYQKTLTADPIVLSKKEYSLVFPEDNLIITKINEIEEEWQVGDIHLEFIGPEKTYTLYFKASRQVKDIFAKFAQGNITANYKKDLRIPNDALLATLNDSSITKTKGEFVVWRDSGSICMIKQKNRLVDGTLTVIQIPLSQIVYYREEGNVRYEQQIFGGGGGGVNLTGAVVGGLLFGGAGAIVGSQYGTESKFESRRYYSRYSLQLIEL